MDESNPDGCCADEESPAPLLPSDDLPSPLPMPLPLAPEPAPGAPAAPAPVKFVFKGLIVLLLNILEVTTQ